MEGNGNIRPWLVDCINHYKSDQSSLPNPCLHSHTNLEDRHGGNLVEDEGRHQAITLHDGLQRQVGLVEPARHLYGNQHLLTLLQPLDL